MHRRSTIAFGVMGIIVPIVVLEWPRTTQEALRGQRWQA